MRVHVRGGVRRREEYRIWARLEPDGPEWKSIQSQHSSASPATPSAASSLAPRVPPPPFFLFFPFLSFPSPPSSFSLSFLVGSLSLWWRRYYWPPVPRECRITLERDGSHLASSIVLLGRLLNFSRDWIGEGFFISSLGCFPVLEKRESCSSSKEPIFLFVRGNSGSMISRVSINLILDRMEEYRGILRNIEKKISNTFCEVNFKAMKRKKKVAIRKNESLGDESTSYAKVKKGEELWQSVEMRQKG